jgi:spore coat polysaccharide biosynthesis protein SpsF
MKVSGLILVRTTSTRLPKKCFLPFGDGCVLEHIVKRANHFNFDPIICTTNENSDDAICELAKSNICRVFRGDTNDKIKRLRDACNHFGIEEFITIDADDPFFDPEVDRQSFRLLEQGYDCVLPPPNYYCGSVGISVKKSILDRAINECDTSNSEMIWKIIERLEGVKLTTIRISNNRMSNIRLTLDYEEDYHLLLAVLRILGPYAEASDIEILFVRNPDLYKINWFRQEQWKENQERAL